MSSSTNTIGQIIKSMGLVFGDIGTSPIYTFTVIFLTIQATQTNIISILSSKEYFLFDNCSNRDITPENKSVS